MEKGKQVMENEVSSEEAMKVNNMHLYPVEPYSSGEGLPYAPVDWPNPSDTWHWWVGKRTSSSGFYQQRLLYLPKRLHVHGGGSFCRFRCKSSLKAYISSQFPDADVEEFFASFSWMVPSTKQLQSEDLHPDLFPRVPLVQIASKRRKEAPGNSKMTKKARLAISQAFPRRRTQQSYKIPAKVNTRNDESVIYLCSLTDDSTSDGSEYLCSPRDDSTSDGSEYLCSPTDGSTSDGSGYSIGGSEPQIDLEDVAPNQRIGSSCYASKDFNARDVQNVQKLHAQFCEEDVDDCLKSLEHILSQHNDEAQVQTPFTYVGSDKAEEMSTYRKKLSSILAQDFSCLLSSEYLEEITFLVEKLAADPILTVDQLPKLKSVEEIPKAGQVFLRTNGIAEQATKFFGDLQAMKDKVSSIKRKFSELRRGSGELQSQINSKSSLVREIDEQIAQLQSRKAELARDLELMTKAKVQAVAEQKIKANSISAVMREIKTAIAEIPIWELKKKNAEKRMAEILAWYAPLKGFSFEKSS